MADVRGKFRVTKITHHYGYGVQAQVTLSAVYTGSAEDNTYAAATPSGTIEMSITNPAAIEKLALGTAFYVDFTAVDETAAS